MRKMFIIMLFICCTFFVACSKNKTVSSNASNIFSNEEVSYETKLETETTTVLNYLRENYSEYDSFKSYTSFGVNKLIAAMNLEQIKLLEELISNLSVAINNSDKLTTDVGFAQGAALLVERLDSLLFKVLHNELLNNNAYFYI